MYIELEIRNFITSCCKYTQKDTTLAPLRIRLKETNLPPFTEYTQSHPINDLQK